MMDHAEALADHILDFLVATPCVRVDFGITTDGREVELASCVFVWSANFTEQLAELIRRHQKEATDGPRSP
jgi:hypothetical protein